MLLDRAGRVSAGVRRTVGGEHVRRRGRRPGHGSDSTGAGAGLMLAALVTLLGAAPHGNRIELKLDRGAGEMVWLSPSTFRFRRAMDGSLGAASAVDAGREPVALEMDESSTAVRIRSKHIEVSI